MKAISINELRSVEGGWTCVCSGCKKRWTSGNKTEAYIAYCTHRLNPFNKCFMKTPLYYWD